jgi:hypothetical protein
MTTPIPINAFKKPLAKADKRRRRNSLGARATPRLIQLDVRIRELP